MKRFISVLLAFLMVTSLAAAFPISAETTGSDAFPVIDITDKVKNATVVEVYQNKLPVIRLDAVLVR